MAKAIQVHGPDDLGPVPVSLVKDVLFVVDLLAHAGAGEIDLAIRSTPFVVADRWLVRRCLLRSLLPLLPPDPGRGRLRVEVVADGGTAVIRASHPARLHSVWTEPQKLARDLRGELQVEGSPERGTTVTIRLPLAAVRSHRKESSCATTSERTSPCA
jgi:hypothetical protein